MTPEVGKGNLDAAPVTYDEPIVMQTQGSHPLSARSEDVEQESRGFTSP